MNYDIKIDKFGNKFYYVNKKMHREDGPAVEYIDGYKAWYVNGKRHREDGPAIEFPNGDKSWWLNDIYYGENDEFTSESWQKFVKTIIFS